ncbi:hypothetical protein QQS21_002092 [Conoideocrella luteorostrata]|uniref:Uncharacterized protein n=1 Tax=Conoideocrella luteorostrata TaxID=1105319 RepID=A0AAJ0CVP5_9HYPO|nr:hypothetical protein QQS21_002092 [Conoideocrella luteorostrata]
MVSDPKRLAKKPVEPDHISRQCSGQSPMCHRIQIVGGKSDPTISLQERGQVSCAHYAQPTTLSTTTQGALTPPTNNVSSTEWFAHTSTAIGRDSTVGSSGSAAITTRTMPTGSSASGAKTSSPSTGVQPPAEGVTGTTTGTTGNSMPTGDVTSGSTANKPDAAATLITTIIVTHTITTLATMPCTTK